MVGILCLVCELFFLFFLWVFKSVLILQMKNHILLRNSRGIFPRYKQEEVKRHNEGSLPGGSEIFTTSF